MLDHLVCETAQERSHQDRSKYQQQDEAELPDEKNPDKHGRSTQEAAQKDPVGIMKPQLPVTLWLPSSAISTRHRS
jgi:hypothetical protein